MTDRELLELAAKAAVNKTLLGNESFMRGFMSTWNPLEDDGAALRLAVRLGFSVEPGKCWHSHYGPAFGEDVLGDVMAATRRAIVRAAAEIGRSM